MAKVCIDCVKEPQLKKLIELYGSINECSLCRCVQLSLDTDDNIFFQLTKALIRFNYSEWDYNHHLGGNSLESYFYGSENIFFNQDRALHSDDYDDMVAYLLSGDVYEEYDKGITIFSGYGENGEQNMPLRSIKDDIDHRLIQISERLERENYFDLENDVKKILDKYHGIAEKVISKGTNFYRARIGYDTKKTSFAAGYETEFHYSPYKDQDISAPPPHLATIGRINRPGVSYLYCGTDKNTAISEIRPHPGDKISIGRFITVRNLRLFDLSDSQLTNFFLNDEILDTYLSFHSLRVMINKTIPPSERQHYLITQLIADCIRQNGFDGILFTSTVGTGDNVVLFKQDTAKYTSDEAEVIEVTAVNYSYTSSPLIESDGLYLEDIRRSKK